MELIKNTSFAELYSKSIAWMQSEIFVTSILVQIFLFAVLISISFIIARKPRIKLSGYFSSKWSKKKREQYNEEALVSLIFPLITLIFIWAGAIITSASGFDAGILQIIAKLLTAWVFIRLTSSLVRFPVWSNIIAIIAWSIAALSITNILEPTTQLLDSFAIELGNFKLSILTVMKGLFSLVVTLWIANFLSKLLERKIHKLPNITPSVRVLMVKIFKVTLITLALLIGLDSLGIDLTALTVFGGAIGLGLGFGLQKVVSNLVSGVILLLDKSVKPGDVIEVDGTYGWVNSLGARCISVLTRDGVEHLIPNESLITEKVVNWSYSSPNVRLKIPIMISYDSDVHKAIELILQAADETPRVLKDPETACRLINLGDNGIEMELRIWLGDPQNGIINVRSSILLAILDTFKEHNIEIPYPQREVSISIPDDIKSLLEGKRK